MLCLWLHGHVLFWLQREYCVVEVIMTVAMRFEVAFGVQVVIKVEW